MYRTAEQDERLQELYVERERVLDHMETWNLEQSEYLNELDAEIETLTTDLDAPRTPKECALDEWQADAKETEFGTLEWYHSLPEVEF